MTAPIRNTSLEMNAACATVAVVEAMGAPRGRTFKHVIDVELPVEYRDEAPWRSYHLLARGTFKAGLLADATIVEIDQDGGDLDCYGLESAPDDVREAALEVIYKAVQS